MADAKRHQEGRGQRDWERRRLLQSAAATATDGLAAHEAAPNPHPQYLLAAAQGLPYSLYLLDFDLTVPVGHNLTYMAETGLEITADLTLEGDLAEIA